MRKGVVWTELWQQLYILPATPNTECTRP